MKAFGANGFGLETEIVEAILYAVDNGAQVVNASFGGGILAIVRDALIAAHAAGVVVVAAAGNEATDLDDPFIFTVYPAASPFVLTVGASTHLDARASFSNFGTRLDLLAPGGGDGGAGVQPDRSILSLRARNSGPGMTDHGALVVGQRWTRQAGTSMSTPHVSGAVALLISHRPGLAPELVRQALRAGADDLGPPGFDTDSGFGRLNAAAALSVEPLAAKIFAPETRTITGAASLDVTGAAFGPSFASWTLEYAAAGPSPSWTTLVGPTTTPVENGPLGTWDLQAVADGRYWLRLRVASTGGAVFEDRVVVLLEHVGLTEPASLQYLGSGPIVVRGSASPADFVSFTVEQRWFDQTQNLWWYWTTDGIDVTGGGLAPVRDGVLATFDPSVLPGGQRLVDLRLVVTTTAGPIYKGAFRLAIDPGLRPGWPRDLPAPGVRVEAEAAPTLADLDGNGLLEVAAATRDQLYVFRHDGALVPGWPLPFAGLDAADVTLADLDGDGRREIVFAARSSVHAVRLDGSALAGFPVSVPNTDDVTRFLAVGDVDGDGRRDVVVTSIGPKPYSAWTAPVSAWVFDDAGRPKPRWPRKVGKTVRVAYPFVVPPVLADLDRDGVLDVAVNTEKLNKLRAYRGDGRPIRTVVKLPPAKTIRLRDAPEPVTAGDLTGDGIPELLVGAQMRQKCVYYEDCYVAQAPLSAITPGSRDGNLPGWPKRFPTFLGDQTHGTGAATVADVDGDGRQEALVGLGQCQGLYRLTAPQCLGVWAIDADGQPAPGFPKPVLTPGLSRMSPPAVGDLDGDGNQEVVWLAYLFRHMPPRVVVWTVPAVGTPARAEWPMARHDAAHTGALTTAP